MNPTRRSRWFLRAPLGGHCPKPPQHHPAPPSSLVTTLPSVCTLPSILPSRFGRVADVSFSPLASPPNPHVALPQFGVPAGGNVVFPVAANYCPDHCLGCAANNFKGAVSVRFDSRCGRHAGLGDAWGKHSSAEGRGGVVVGRVSLADPRLLRQWRVQCRPEVRRGRNKWTQLQFLCEWGRGVKQVGRGISVSDSGLHGLPALLTGGPWARRDRL